MKSPFSSIIEFFVRLNKNFQAYRERLFIPTRENMLKRYGMAILSLGIAMRLDDLPYLRQTPALVYFAAVAFSAWYSGFWPALLISVLYLPQFAYSHLENHSFVAALPSFIIFLAVAILISSLVESARIANEQLRASAFLDSLTGLLNRAALEERFAEAIKLAKRHDYFLAVLYIDIDNFKTINDTYGHECGDIVLKKVAERLTASVRDADIVSRLGGDEFIVILTELRQGSDTMLVAHKVIQLGNEPCEIDQYTLRCPLSIGISVYPYDGDMPAVLIHCADRALYQAKAKGKNCYSFYNDVGQVQQR